METLDKQKFSMQAYRNSGVLALLMYNRKHCPFALHFNRLTRFKMGIDRR
jgi:hypothetical protein